MNKKKSGWLLSGVGGPGCGKTTLKKILKAAAVYLTGFHFFDMSDDIIAWHKDTRNGSPLRDAFSGAADKERKKGNLFGAEVINAAVKQYLEHIESVHGEIRRACIFGWPRSEEQIKYMLDLDKHAQMAMIEIAQSRADQNRLLRIEKGEGRPDDEPEVFSNRWKTYDTTTKPSCIDFGQQHLDQFRRFDFGVPLKRKALAVIHFMNIKPEESGSMVARINDPKSEAGILIMMTVNPTKAHAAHSAPTETVKQHITGPRFVAPNKRAFAGALPGQVMAPQ